MRILAKGTKAFLRRPYEGKRVDKYIIIYIYIYSALRIIGPSYGRLWTCKTRVQVLKILTFQGSGFLEIYIRSHFFAGIALSGRPARKSSDWVWERGTSRLIQAVKFEHLCSKWYSLYDSQRPKHGLNYTGTSKTRPYYRINLNKMHPLHWWCWCKLWRIDLYMIMIHIQ